MSDGPDSDRVGEAIKILQEEFEQPHFELSYSEYSGDTYIDFHCQDPPAGIEASPVGKYRLESIDLSGNTIWNFTPVDTPR